MYNNFNVFSRLYVELKDDANINPYYNCCAKQSSLRASTFHPQVLLMYLKPSRVLNDEFGL